MKIAYSVIGSVTIRLGIASVAQLLVFHHTKSQPDFVHVYSERSRISPLITSTLHVVAVQPLVSTSKLKVKVLGFGESFRQRTENPFTLGLSDEGLTDKSLKLRKYARSSSLRIEDQ